MCLVSESSCIVIAGFTSMSKAVSPAQVMDLLNELFTLFDKLARQYNVSVVLGHCDMLYHALGFSRRDVYL